MTCRGLCTLCHFQFLHIQPTSVDPALAAFFNENTPVPDDEIPRILDILDSASGHLDSISAQVTQVQQILDHLLHVRAQQSQFVARHTSMISTFRRLPNEILGVIFQFCVVAEQKNDSKPVVGKTGDIRWRLAAVCSRWRRVICDGMPSLWASIGIDNGSLMDSEKSRVDRLLRASLACSGSYPLSVEYSFFADSWFRGVMPVIDRKCVELVWKESKRWRDIALVDFPFESEVVLGNSSLDHNLPLLKELFLRPVISSPSPADSITTFATAPNLQHVRIHKLSRPLIALPWPQLLSYEAEHDMHGTLYVLGQALNIHTYVALEPAKSSHPAITPPIPSLLPITTSDPLSQPLLHPCLQTLHLTGTTVPILSHICLPSLTTLRISGMDTRHFGILTEFLFRNYGRLQWERSYLSSRTQTQTLSKRSPSLALDTLQITLTLGPPVPLTRFIEAVTLARVRKLDLCGPGHVKVDELVLGLTVPGVGFSRAPGTAAARDRDTERTGTLDMDGSDSGSLSPASETEIIMLSASDSDSVSSSTPDPASLPSSTSSSPSQTHWPPKLWGTEASGSLSELGLASPTRLSDPISRRVRVSPNQSKTQSSTPKYQNQSQSWDQARIWEEDIPMPDLEHLGIGFEGGLDGLGENTGNQDGNGDWEEEENLIGGMLRMVESRIGMGSDSGLIHSDGTDTRLRKLKSLTLYTFPLFKLQSAFFTPPPSHDDYQWLEAQLRNKLKTRMSKIIWRKNEAFDLELTVRDVRERDFA